MLAVVNDGGIEGRNHIHINMIDSMYTFVPLWIEDALSAYRIALDVRDHHKLPFTVSLDFCLRESRELQGMNFSSLDELVAQLQKHDPPALFLLIPDQEFWFGIESGIREYNVLTGVIVMDALSELFRPLVPISRCYYMEYRPAGTDFVYCRQFVIDGQPNCQAGFAHGSKDTQGNANHVGTEASP